MTIDRMYSGRLMPSRPIVYVALIGVIQLLVREELQLARPGRSRTGSACTMPTASVAAAVTMADALDQRLVALRDEQHHQHAGQRQEGAEAEQPLLVLSTSMWSL